MADLDLFLQKHAPATMNLIGSIPVDKWAGQNELMNLESQYGFGSAGLPSIARHTAGMSNLSDTFSSALAFDKNNPGGISQFFGDVGAFGLGALNEIPGTYRGLTGSAKDKSETWEDIVSNWEGTFGTPYGISSEDIYKNVYGDERTRKKIMDQRATQKGIADANMQRKIREAEAAQAQAAANAAAAGQRRAGRGGSHMSRSVSQGGLGISAAQAQSISDANAAAGMSGWGLARGGLIDLYRYGGFI